MKYKPQNIIVFLLVMALSFACSPATQTPESETPAPTVQETIKTPEPAPIMHYADLKWSYYSVDAGQIAKFNINDLGSNSCIAVQSAEGETPVTITFSQEILPEISPVNGKFTTLKVACPVRTLGDATRIAKQMLQDGQVGSTLAISLFVRENTVDCSWWACNALPDNWKVRVRGAEGLDNVTSQEINSSNVDLALTSGYPAALLFSCSTTELTAQEEFAVIVAPNTAFFNPCPGEFSVTGHVYYVTDSCDAVGLQLALMQKAQVLIENRGNYLPLYEVTNYRDLLGWGYWHYDNAPTVPTTSTCFQPTMIPDYVP